MQLHLFKDKWYKLTPCHVAYALFCVSFGTTDLNSDRVLVNKSIGSSLF